MPESAARFAHYEQTIIEITLPDGSTTSTAPREPPPAALLGLLPVYVITAWNPAGERLSDGANAAAHQKMLELVRRDESTGSPPLILDAIGRSRAGHHYEVSVAVVGISLASAIKIGQELQQDAIFAINAGGTHVVACPA